MQCKWCHGTTCIDSKVGHQVTSHALPHCLGLPYWHYQLGKLSYKKNGKKRGHCPLLATPPPKRVKRGHLLSDYRQKCVNGTRDSYCGVKSPFLSDLRLILTHIVVSKVHFCLILWCQKSISE